MRGSFVTAGLVVLVLAAVVVGLAGCESSESKQSAVWVTLADVGDEEAADLFHVDVSFWRRYAKKNWYYDRDREFKVKRRSYVKARVDVRNATPGRVYPLHIVWIKPGGRELYRKYVEVELTANDSVGYVADVVWKKAEDLGYRKQERREVPEPGFLLESSFDISAQREREPGEYRLRVYLDRRLLLDQPFVVIGP